MLSWRASLILLSPLPVADPLHASMRLPLSSKVVRKSIARVLTVINQTQKDQLRKAYCGKPAGGTHSRKALVTMKYHRFCSHRPRAEFLLYRA